MILPGQGKREIRSLSGIERILQEADIITVHVPLTMTGEDKTYHLFDDINFNKMKKGSWFFNSSRGEVAETIALKKVLGSSDTGRSSHRCLGERTGYRSRTFYQKYLLATPHIAGYSTDGKANGTAMVVNYLSSFFSLPLENWYPGNVPEPLFPEIVIDGTGKTDEDIIREAVIHTYNIKTDDEKFRKSPADFEKQRGDYP